MKYNYFEIIKDQPDRIKVVGNIEYVQNPYFSDRPVIKIDRSQRTAIETDFFEWEMERDVIS